LVLLTGLSASAMTGCDQSPENAGAVSSEGVYVNNYYIPGAGYYHAPFRGWYELPYNHFDARRQLYFFGGQWSPRPDETITNISSPTPAAVEDVNARRTDIVRGGFGSTGRGHYRHRRGVSVSS
jgi:hypothetical protein